MLKIITNIIVFVSILLAFNQAGAARVDGLYDVEILLADELLSTRKKAFDQGLDEVFVRISGDSVVMDKIKRPSASRYVKQFSYDPVAEPTADDHAANDTADNTTGDILKYRLKIQYNGSAMERYLLANDVAVWGVYRPNIVVWLVVRDGRNEYVLKDTDQSLLKTTAVDALKRRGIPVRWPVYDEKDKKILSVSDIRGGFKTPLHEASRRYSRGPVLAGSMIWNGKQWQSSWSLLTKDDDRHWNLDETDHEQLVNKAIDQTADALGVIFAVRTANGQQQHVRVRVDVQAVSSIENYRFVEKYLSELSAVKKVTALHVDGENAIFEVTLRSNEEDFLDLMNNSSRFTAIDTFTAIKSREPGVQNLAPLIEANDDKTTNDPSIIEPANIDSANTESADGNLKYTATAGVNNVEAAEAKNQNSSPTEESNELPLAEQRVTYYYKLNSMQ